MIVTVAELESESGVSRQILRAYLYQWRLRGWANPTGATVAPARLRSGPHEKLWNLRDTCWQKFLNRSVRSIDYLALDGRQYLIEAMYRYRNRVAHTKRVYRRLRAESFARRNPFVML
jgi:hypothetical protein